MRRKKGRRHGKKHHHFKPKIIRCFKYMKPVFDNEKCNEYQPKNPNDPKNCKFCKFSENKE